MHRDKCRRVQVVMTAIHITCLYTACGNAPQTSLHELNRYEYRFNAQLANDITRQFRQEIRDDLCNKALSHQDKCSVTRTFSDGQFKMADHSDEPVLIIEYDIDDFLATTRYRQRTKAFFKIEQGRIVKKDTEVRLPRVMARLLERLENASYLPAHSFDELAQIVLNRYPSLGLEHFGHNTPIFEIIAEYNPRTPLVLLEGFTSLENMFDSDIICNASSEENKREHIRARTRAFNRDFRDLLVKQGIRYINMSLGMSSKTTAHSLQSLCSGMGADKRRRLVELILEDFAPILKTVHESDGVLSVQSAPYGYDGPFDCSKQYRHRIVVGAFNAPHRSLDPDGLAKLSRGTIRHGLCADIYVNFNFTASDNRADTLMASLGMGLGMARIGGMSSISTSNAAPLALSRIIHLRHGRGLALRSFSNDLIQRLRSAITPSKCGHDRRQPCLFQDPLAHRQAEVYRMNYW